MVNENQRHSNGDGCIATEWITVQSGTGCGRSARVYRMWQLQLPFGCLAPGAREVIRNDV